MKTSLKEKFKIKEVIVILPIAFLLSSICLSEDGQTSTTPPPLVKDLNYFLRRLVDIEGLTNTTYVQCKMISTYDKGGGNADGTGYVKVEGNIATIAEIKGPGAIVRFYSARPGGTLKIYLDDSEKPQIDMDCQKFFQGKTQPFLEPIVGKRGGSWYSFFPIPFAKSCRVQIEGSKSSEKNFGLYYQITYLKFPKNEKVESFNMNLLDDEKATLKKVVEIWKNVGEDPKGTKEGQASLEKKVKVPSGDISEIARIDGPGIIDALQIKISSSDNAIRRKALLRMFWDGEAMPSVDCPIGDFFGNGFDDTQYKSLLMGLTEDGYYCYFPMPFSEGARIVIVNDSQQAIDELIYRIVYRKTPKPGPEIGRFCAKWRREEVSAVNLRGSNLTGEYNYRILDVKGQGRYIGCNLNVYNRHLIWWGEGDPMIFVDDDTWPPSFHGTGTEEYFNDGWGFHGGHAPVSGAIIPGISPGSCYGPNAVYTFHISDSITFSKSIKVTIEHGTENNLSNDYSSTAYWYQQKPGTDFFTMRPVYERLPPPKEQWKKLMEEAHQKVTAQAKRNILRLSKDIDEHPTTLENLSERIIILIQWVQQSSKYGIKKKDVDAIVDDVKANWGLSENARVKAVDRAIKKLKVLTKMNQSPKL